MTFELRKNATLEDGVAWLKWSPRGEGLNGRLYRHRVVA